MCFVFVLTYFIRSRFGIIGFENVSVSSFFVGLLVHVYFFLCFVPFLLFFLLLLCVPQKDT